MDCNGIILLKMKMQYLLKCNESRVAPLKSDDFVIASCQLDMCNGGMYFDVEPHLIG